MLVVFIRAVLLYFLVIFCMRLMGKRQLGELQPSELVTTILISNIAALPIEDTNIPMILGAVPILALVMFEFVVSALSLKSKRFRGFFSGNPVVIIKDGIINQKQLKKLRFSIDDLMEALREKGILADTEDDGQLSLMPAADNELIRRLKDMDVNTLTPIEALQTLYDICKEAGAY